MKRSIDSVERAHLALAKRTAFMQLQNLWFCARGGTAWSIMRKQKYWTIALYDLIVCEELFSIKTLLLFRRYLSYTAYLLKYW